MNYLASDLKVVGTRPIRPDGVDKVTGRAKFGADMAMAGMLWGKVKRSPHAHARIVDDRRLQGAGAARREGGGHRRRLPGHPVGGGVHVGEGPTNFRDLSRNCMARGKALYEGHAVAAVAATTPGDRRGGARPDRRDSTRCCRTSSTSRRR